MIQQRYTSRVCTGLILTVLCLAAARSALCQDEAVSLSAGAIISLLRSEPGLLLQSKKAVLKAASDEGRLLDTQEVTDEALYNLIREDESVRVLITHEIEERHYVQAKPTRQELERGLVFESPTQRSVKQASQEADNPQTPNQEDTYWANHERALEQPERRPAENELAPPLTGSPATGKPRMVSPTPDENENDVRRQVDSAGAEFLPSPFPDDAIGDANQMPWAQPDETPRLSRASLPDPGTVRPKNSVSPIAVSPEMHDSLPTESSELPQVDILGNLAPARNVPRARPKPPAPAPEEERPHPKSNPYANVPSLYDLYTQYSSRQPEPARFGTEIFFNGTGNFDELPMDLPVGPEYVLGPGDGLSIELFGGVSQRLQRVVDRTGRVALPEVGAVEVSGRNLGEVQRAVQDILRTQYRDVQADISLSRLRTVRVYVVGDVVRPGAYDLSSLSTPLNALYQAGGPTARGSLRILRHYRGRQIIQQTDVYDLLLHGVRTGVEGLEPGDTILVPPLGSQVTVEGMVRRPAIYELNGEKNLADVLQLAGGVLQSGTLSHIDVERVEAHMSRTMLRLDIPDDGDRESVTRALEAFKIEDGDRIKISPILPYAGKAVYLAGHVVSPGKFAYRDGMVLTDIVKAYSDLLPEPYKQHAEIIRLSPPDYMPSIIAFNLDDALAAKAHEIPLRPFDTIRIFGRFDFEDPPVVRVNGEVRHPGDHVTNGATRVRDAIYLAGGTTRDAQLIDAQVFRREQNGKLEVISLNLSRALEGDEHDNILLEPKDQILIHRNRNKLDPPSVKIEGEIAQPGRYPLGEGMTAAGLVRLAGGLKRSAYTEEADLTRFQIDGGNDVAGQHVTIPIGRAMSSEPTADVPLHDGDVLTIRQIAGWNDLGATIIVKGEVVHAGAYGIREGERLSSVIARAGGFRDDAYPYGAIFQRVQVKEIEERNRIQLLSQLQQEGVVLKGLPSSDSDDKLVKDASVLQWKATVERLENTPPAGRLVIHISKDLKRWTNTSADIEVGAGDAIYIPRRPGTVVVDGAVFNPTAIAFKPGKNAGWYLRQAGGPSNTGNKKEICVVRADGSVIGGSGGMFSGGIESAQLFAGDTVVVPEKAFSGTTRWKTTFQISQVLQAAAIAASVGRTF